MTESNGDHDRIANVLERIVLKCGHDPEWERAWIDFASGVYPAKRGWCHTSFSDSETVDVLSLSLSVLKEISI